jgi:hypothetical protein
LNQPALSPYVWCTQTGNDSCPDAETLSPWSVHAAAELKYKVFEYYECTSCQYGKSYELFPVSNELAHEHCFCTKNRAMTEAIALCASEAIA